jgi:hypothetical protein
MFGPGVTSMIAQVTAKVSSVDNAITVPPRAARAV